MQLRAGGDDVGDTEAPRRAVDPRERAPGLLHEQRAGGQVPRLEVELPVAVEPAGRDVGEVERGAAGRRRSRIRGTMRAVSARLFAASVARW